MTNIFSSSVSCLLTSCCPSSFWWHFYVVTFVSCHWNLNHLKIYSSPKIIFCFNTSMVSLLFFVVLPIEIGGGDGVRKKPNLTFSPQGWLCVSDTIYQIVYTFLTDTISHLYHIIKYHLYVDSKLAALKPDLTLVCSHLTVFIVLNNTVICFEF